MNGKTLESTHNTNTSFSLRFITVYYFVRDYQRKHFTSSQND